MRPALSFIHYDFVICQDADILALRVAEPHRERMPNGVVDYLDACDIRSPLLMAWVGYAVNRNPWPSVADVGAPSAVRWAREPAPQLSRAASTPAMSPARSLATSSRSPGKVSLSMIPRSSGSTST
jgi:hypothetical protein